MALNREEKQENPAESLEKGFKPPPKGLFDLAKPTKPLGAGEASDAPLSLELLDLNGLLELRGRIDARLPPRSLADLDLEEELLLQFARTKQLYDDVVANKETPANQKAQVANACTAILQDLTAMQSKIYSAERNKALEGALIRALRSFPEDELQKRFLDFYERALDTLGLPAPTTTETAAPV